jgi:hypothetical protein
VRHGHLPEREIMTGIGPVAVRCPRVRDRLGAGSERIHFSSAILPPYARRTKSQEVLIPILYLEGVACSAVVAHLAAMPNRFIARIIVTWFQTSPPRGVLMPRISRQPRPDDRRSVY